MQYVHEDFRSIREVMKSLGISGVHGVLADLGMSSLHVEAAERGFVLGTLPCRHVQLGIRRLRRRS